MSEKIKRLHYGMCDFCDKIKSFFTNDVRVAIVVRNTECEGSHVLSGDATIEDIEAVLSRLDSMKHHEIRTTTRNVSIVKRANQWMR